jgi:hypothetical protein
MNGASPVWSNGNLVRHHAARLNEDPGCFEDLLNITGRTMTASEYERRSLDAVQFAWAEYEGEGRDVRGRSYYPTAAYFVDGDLVVAITDMSRHLFFTCYHEHFNSRRHTSHPVAIRARGGLQLRYIEHLKLDELGGLIRNLRRIRGV